MNKVFVIGPSKGYANWLPDCKLVNNPDEADILLFTGGEDVNPAIYGEPVGKRTYFNEQRDKIEADYFNKYPNKLKLGICRGSQLLCALSGGRLVQDQNNPDFIHDIITSEGTVIPISSTHHQAQYPYDMDKRSYKLLAWTEGICHHHHDGNNKEISDKPFKEAEIIFYPHTKSLAIQGHPEMMWRTDKYPETFEYLNKIFNKFVNQSL